MPWLAIPYEKRNIKEKLCNMFNVKTIPQVIFLNSEFDILDIPGRVFIEKNKDNIIHIIRELNL